MQTKLSARSPAKINITLRVGPLRTDDFHDVESLVAPIDLCDEVTVEPAPAGTFQITCSDPGIPADATNLAARAARLLSQYVEHTGGVRIHLEKRIPAGSGLGGGSSNAASVIRLLNELWRLGLDDRDLQEVAAQLGSDVPLFLQSGPCLVRGRGEIVSPLPLQARGYAVLLLSDIHCSTAQVYRRFDEMAPPPTRISPIYFASAVRRASHLIQTAYNDLEPAAFSVAPSLGRIMLRAASQCDWPVRMSGSGSTLYTLADSLDAAEQVARRWDGLAARTVIAPLLV